MHKNDVKLKHSILVVTKN